MRKLLIKYSSFLFIALAIMSIFSGMTVKAASENQKQFVFDQAMLLTDTERTELESLAVELGEETETALLVLTLDGIDGKDIKKYVEDYYDDEAPGYDQPFGNTAILAIDMEQRDIYLADFKKAEDNLDNATLDYIREQITPALSEGDYFEAFSTFMHESAYYLVDDPANLENDYDYSGIADSRNEYIEGNSSNGMLGLLSHWGFQLIVSIVLAGIVVSIMVFRSGGKVTVNGNTYMDKRNSKIINRHDRFIRKTVTKQRKPQNNSGGGGGITGGGHSHSGSRGKF
ncbi:TPM domain-containing protein [Niallia sp. MER TA 168]|uniref:TPM domain-containing protein n=1 Tax=Niallia sp. MER TA 168 TaxID=2939568 RepID=UPI00203BC406|nr:TPM domain-containing protein [Niallia sp. MER TA 168]MCM3362314.1 TPM domain-containing protein [Niallia sp. MER TA 168]